jgi:hypothetical protein
MPLWSDDTIPSHQALVEWALALQREGIARKLLQRRMKLMINGPEEPPCPVRNKPVFRGICPCHQSIIVVSLKPPSVRRDHILLFLKLVTFMVLILSTATRDQPSMQTGTLTTSKSMGGPSLLDPGPEDEEWSGVAATMYDEDEASTIFDPPCFDHNLRLHIRWMSYLPTD